ncbi:MAG: dihydroorotase [Bacteroidia bacterium]
MENVLFKHIRLIDPASDHHEQQVDLLVVQGQIAAIAAPGSLAPEVGTQVVDTPDACVSPGWVDMQVHLSDPGFEHKESLAQLARAAQRGGFTSILCYPNTQPVIDQSQAVHALLRRAAGLPVQVWISGSITHGGAGKELAELYDMHQSGAVAFTDGTHSLQSSGVLMRALQYAQAFDALLIDMPLDLALAADGHMNEGVQAARLGMSGIPELAEIVPVVRNLELLRYTGGRLHFQPVTSPVALQHIHSARQQLPGISTGVPVCYLVLDDSVLEDYDSNYRLVPPLRDQQQVEALRKALRAGQIDVLTSGHQAQGLEEKEVEFALAEPGMLGLQTAFSLAYKHLIEPGLIDLADWVRLVSQRPREILRQPAVVLAVGQSAELTLFHPARTWTLHPGDIPSRACNSAWVGQELTGAVLGTYVHGRLNLQPVRVQE